MKAKNNLIIFWLVLINILMEFSEILVKFYAQQKNCKGWLWDQRNLKKSFTHENQVQF